MDAATLGLCHNRPAPQGPPILPRGPRRRVRPDFHAAPPQSSRGRSGGAVGRRGAKEADEAIAVRERDALPRWLPLRQNGLHAGVDVGVHWAACVLDASVQLLSQRPRPLGLLHRRTTLLSGMARPDVAGTVLALRVAACNVRAKRHLDELSCYTVMVIIWHCHVTVC